MELLMRLFLAFLFLLVFGMAAAEAQTPTPDPCDPAGDAVYFVGRGSAFFAAKDYTRAIEAFTCAIQRDPNSVEAHAERGYARSVQGDEPGALADFNRALELDDGYISAYVNRGSLYVRQGNFALAINDLNLALILDANNVIALHNRAVVHAAEFNYELAMADLNAALALTPEDPELHAALGAVYLALATQSYGQFRTLAGENIPITGGAPQTLYLALERNTLTGNFGEWLAFLRPAQD